MNRNAVPWYCEKQFARYWEVYNKCMTYAHKDALSHCSAIKSEIKSSLYSMVKAPLPRFSTNVRKKKLSSRKKKKRRKQRRLKRKAPQFRPTPSRFVLMDNDTLHAHVEDEDSIDDIIDVDDDFLAFIETSVKHRIKWNEIKESKKCEQSSMDFSSSDDNIIKQEHPDVLRGREMKQLYGSSAPKIHGMETAMQLSFDRICTLHQPAIWPIIPIKL